MFQRYGADKKFHTLNDKDSTDYNALLTSLYAPFLNKRTKKFIYEANTT